MQTSAQSSIEKLVELYYPPVFHFAARLCGDPVRAMILTQRTFRLALDRSRSLPVPANTRAWLYTLLFHKFLEVRPRSFCV
jgi:DNA-directed RNA polymerase specialized sigma24 family protein